MSHPFAHGIISAAMLPFEENGAIDWRTYDRYIARVAAGGPQAIAMNMDASEGASLSIDEQLEVARHTKKLLGDSVPFISGLLTTYTEGAVDMAKRLVDCGVDGITIFAPLPVFMGSPLPAEMIEDYHRAVADAVDVPLIAFQYPLSFVNYPRGTVTAFTKIDRIVAMKEASFDVAKTSDAIDEARAAPRRIGIMTGSDTFILEAMLLGCDGALIGFAGAATAELVRMQQLAERKEATEAYEIWNRLGPVARFCWGAPLRDYRVRMKQFLMLQGVLPNCHVRAPTSQITKSDAAYLEKIVKQHGLTEARFMPEGASKSGAKVAAE